MCIDLVELQMHDFNVILAMDYLHSCYACIGCRNRIEKFRFPNEEELVWEGYNLSCPNPLISNIKAKKKDVQGVIISSCEC